MSDNFATRLRSQSGGMLPCIWGYAMEYYANARPQPTKDRSPGGCIDAQEGVSFELRVMWETVEKRTPCHRNAVGHGAIACRAKSGPPRRRNVH